MIISNKPVNSRPFRSIIVESDYLLLKSRMLSLPIKINVRPSMDKILIFAKASHVINFYATNLHFVLHLQISVYREILMSIKLIRISRRRRIKMLFFQLASYDKCIVFYSYFNSLFVYCAL